MTAAQSKDVSAARKAIANLTNPDWLAEWWPLATAAQVRAAIADEQATIDTAGEASNAL